MPDRITPEEFRRFMQPWDPAAVAVFEERMRTGYTRESLEQFNPDEALTMRAALDRLIPHGEDIDLVGFMDWATGKPLGRGDRRPGMPDEPELFRLGLAGLDQAARSRRQRRFHELPPEDQDAVLTAVQQGSAEGEAWRRVPSDYFFMRFYAKALHGYFAHPRAWMRIGFPGAAYPEGYLWVRKEQVKGRHSRTVGWDRL